MKATKVKLVIDGIKVDVGHELLEQIARYIEDIPANTKVFEKLASSPNHFVRYEVARMKSINRKIVKILLKDTKHANITTILDNSEAAKLLKMREILAIMKLNNPIHWSSIASNMDDFHKVNTCKLAKKILKHDDPTVRASLIDRWNHIPKKIIRKLTKDSDTEISFKAKEALL